MLLWINIDRPIKNNQWYILAIHVHFYPPIKKQLRNNVNSKNQKNKKYLPPLRKKPRVLLKDKNKIISSTLCVKIGGTDTTPNKWILHLQRSKRGQLAMMRKRRKIKKDRSLHTNIGGSFLLVKGEINSWDFWINPNNALCIK